MSWRDGLSVERAGEYLALDGFRVCPRWQVLLVVGFRVGARLARGITGASAPAASFISQLDDSGS